MKRGRYEEKSMNKSIRSFVTKRREGTVDREREDREVEYDKSRREYSVTQKYEVEKSKNMCEGKVDTMREENRVDQDERDNQVERKSTTTTLRERTKMFGETRLEKIERESKGRKERERQV